MPAANRLLEGDRLLTGPVTNEDLLYEAGDRGGPTAPTDWAAALSQHNVARVVRASPQAEGRTTRHTRLNSCSHSNYHDLAKSIYTVTFRFIRLPLIRPPAYPSWSKTARRLSA